VACEGMLANALGVVAEFLVKARTFPDGSINQFSPVRLVEREYISLG